MCCINVFDNEGILKALDYEKHQVGLNTNFIEIHGLLKVVRRLNISINN